VGPRLKRLLKNIEPGDASATRGRWHEARQNAHGGRFACTVWAQKSHDFALANFEIQILDRRLAGVTFRQILNLNHCAIFSSDNRTAIAVVIFLSTCRHGQSSQLMVLPAPADYPDGESHVPATLHAAKQILDLFDGAHAGL